MIKVEHVETWGFAHAIRGMRNPMNSWNKSDSGIKPVKIYDVGFHDDDIRLEFVIGEHDLELMKQLYQAGIEHGKYLRQIFVSMDIIAPLYWWKQMDTYKIGITSNSCSTMHTIMNKPFEMDDFSLEKAKILSDDKLFTNLMETLNDHRDVYLNFEKYRENGTLGGGFTKKDVFDSLIQILPSSYNQKRTITMNYENVFNIIHQREYHGKLDEWKEFVSVLKELPYIKKIGGINEEK